MNPTVCSNCGQQNPPDAIFCGSCGQKVEQQQQVSPEPMTSSAAPKSAKKGSPLIALIGAVFMIGIGAAVFLVVGDAPEENDAIGMLENSFAGGYSGAQIQDTMDKTMTRYGTERNNENYLTCGALLTALRFETEKEEMEILEEMLDRYEAGKNASFDEAAREAARALSH